MKESPAIQLLRLVWENEGFQMGPSWDRLNRSMSNALSLAIAAGMRFWRNDFSIMEAESEDRGFRFGYWGGTSGHMLGEGFYTMACHSDRWSGEKTYGINRSACQAFEHWKKRRPFIVKNAGATGKRIAVGTKFRWGGKEVTCTSFDKDGTYLVACSYHCSTEGDWTARRKVAGRYTITHKQLQAANRAVTTERRKNDEDEGPRTTRGGQGR